MKFATTLHLVFQISNLKDILKHIRNDNNFLKYNNTKMKRELRYIYREPQIILQRAAGWPPLAYNVASGEIQEALIVDKQ